jgi:ribulose-phosphate 3-epimerase
VATTRLFPSLLAADFTRLGEQIRAADAAGIDGFHVDVMDGRFVPNIAIGIPVLQSVRKCTTSPLDIHLMIVEPDHLLPAFAEAGANRLTVHVETCPNLHQTLRQIRALGCDVGVAINPHSPALLLSEVLHLVDVVLVMTVNPGFGGQAFLHETLPKIAQLRTLITERGLSTHIQVDGGMNAETAPLVIAAGADELVFGSAIFNDQHAIAHNITMIRQGLPDSQPSAS